MQENFDEQSQKIADIESEIRVNMNLASNQLDKISKVATAELNKFKDSEIFAKHHKYVEELKKLTREFEGCNQNLKEVQETASGSGNYLYKLEALFDEYKYINIDVMNLLKELDQFGKEVSMLAEKRFQAKKSDYDKAVGALQNEIAEVRSVNEPIDGYIQPIETTISHLEKNGVNPSLLTVPKQILQQPRQAIQQVVDETDSANRNLQNLISNPPTSESIVTETISISRATAKLKQVNQQLTTIDYSLLSIAESYVKVIKDSVDLANKVNSIENRISSNLDHLDIATATDGVAANLDQQNSAEKVQLEQGKKNLQAINAVISQLNTNMSNVNLQDPIVAEKTYDATQLITKRIEGINNNLNLIQAKVESISNQVHERNFAPVNTLKQRLEQIKLKRDESGQLGFRNHEKEINEKIKDFNDQCLALETNFDNLTRSQQKDEIKKLEILVLQLERYLSSRYYDMAVNYQSFEEENKKLEADISKSNDNLQDIKAVKDASDVGLKRTDRLIAKNTAEGMSKDASKESIKNRILGANEELNFGKDYNERLFVAKSDPKHLDSQVSKLRENARKFVDELDDFIDAIDEELQKGAFVRGYSLAALQAFKRLGGAQGDQIAAEMGKEWGIDRENERREKIQNVLKEVKEIRDELIALKIDESYTGQLSKEASVRIEKLVDKLNKKSSKLNLLMNVVQEGISHFTSEIGKLFGQTSDAKEASVFNIFMRDLCVRTSRFLRRVQLQNDYRDWRVLHDEEPARQEKRTFLQDKRQKLSDKQVELTSELREAKREHEQLLNLQAVRENPLKDVEWPLTYQNDEGNTLLHTAVAKNNVEMLLVFLQQSEHESLDSEALNIKNKQGKTPVDLAVETNNVSILNLLLKEESHLDYNRWRSIVNSKDPQLISQFAQIHDIETYTSHIDFMTDRKLWMSVLKNTPDAKAGFLLDAQDKNGNSLLHAAIQSQDIQDAKWLLSNSAVITIKNKQGDLPADLMKKMNEKYSKQRMTERNQSYLGMSISGLSLAGALLVGGLAVSGPVGWIVAGVVGLIGLVGLVKNFIDAYDASAVIPPYSIPVIPSLTTEKLLVDGDLLAHLDKNGIKVLNREQIKPNQWKIEVSSATNEMIKKIGIHKAEVEATTAGDLGVFKILQSNFNAIKQIENKLILFKNFLAEVREMAPDILEEFKQVDGVLRDQLNQFNQLNQLMMEADRARVNAEQHLKRYEFSLVKKELSRFKDLVNDNNLEDAIKQVSRMQESVQAIESDVFLKLKEKLAGAIVLDVNHFEELRNAFAECKGKQELILKKMQNTDPVLTAELEGINAQVVRAERLIELGVHAKIEAVQNLKEYEPSLFEALKRFVSISKRLENTIQKIDEMQKGIEAKIAQPVGKESSKVEPLVKPSKGEEPLKIEPQKAQPREEKPTQPESSQKESAHSSYAQVFSQLISEKFEGMKKAFEEEKKEVKPDVPKPDVPKIEQESGVAREHFSAFKAMRQKARMAAHQATQQDKGGKSADRDVKPPTRGQ